MCRCRWAIRTLAPLCRMRAAWAGAGSTARARPQTSTARRMSICTRNTKNREPPACGAARDPTQTNCAHLQDLLQQQETQDALRRALRCRRLAARVLAVALVLGAL